MAGWARKGFLIAQAALYAALLVLDCSGHMALSVPVKYAGILLCVAAVLPSARTADGRLAALALIVTAGADWFLLVQDNHYAAGVGLFCVVQAVYCVRLACWRGRICGRLLAVRLVFILGFLILPRMLDALALFYFANLACNAIEAVCFSPRCSRQRMFALGLCLFVCCDLCVGAFNLGLFTGVTARAMWLFYLPSQVLLALCPYEKGTCA